MTQPTPVESEPMLPSNPDGSSKHRRKRFMNAYFWILLLVAWLVLLKFILPSFGVPT